MLGRAKNLSSEFPSHTSASVTALITSFTFETNDTDIYTISSTNDIQNIPESILDGMSLKRLQNS